MLVAASAESAEHGQCCSRLAYSSDFVSRMLMKTFDPIQQRGNPTKTRALERAFVVL
jgi:hypothetical protein